MIKVEKKTRRKTRKQKRKRKIRKVIKKKRKQQKIQPIKLLMPRLAADSIGCLISAAQVDFVEIL